MSEEVDLDRLHERLEAMGGTPQEAKKRSGPTTGKVMGALAVLGVLGLAAYVLNQADIGEEPLATAQPDDWQGTGDGYETMTPPAAAAAAAPQVPEPIPAAAPPAVVQVAPAAPSETELALLQRLSDMQAQLDAMRAAPTEDDGSADEIARLSEQLDALSDETEELQQERRAADQLARERGGEVRRLEAALAAAQADLEAARYMPPGEAAPVVEAQATPAADDGDAERLAQLAERQAQAADERQARIDSPLIAFGGSAAPGEPGPAAGAPDLGQDEAFLRAGARPAAVEQAVVIANPSRTVIQGTVIQAAMETAIDSSLPGAIRAVVSEDVHSFDGTRVLIPRSSKLFGRYNSQLEPTQRRLMIAWDRIITPDGQSVTIAAYGADELGRSGTTGTIDRRLGTRFGSAALVSLISALPSAAAASVNDDPLAAEIAEELGGDAEDAAGSVLDPYLSVAPTIYIDQGARITVIVDRDLELY